MSQNIVIQVGQCGNQIGGRFWDLVFQEHSSHNTKNEFDDATATFFRNVDVRKGISNVPVGKGTNKIQGLRARSVMIDMEEGVINQIRTSPFRKLFDEDQIISSNSGSGNNWAVGYTVYGQTYYDRILDSLRRESERCDSLQSFFMISSLGGGTGSGLGSRISEMLADEFENVFRFNAVLSPSANDDVVTSPYNSILSLSKLIDNSDCVLPMENQALADIVNLIHQKTDSAIKKKTSLTDSGARPHGGLCGGSKKPHPFEEMNNIAANLLINMTSSMRFEGSMNVDISDIVTNLVPFPRQKFLLSSMTPLYTLADLRLPPKRIDQHFTDAFSRDSQLVRADPKSGTYLAVALMARGDVEVSDIRRNIDRLTKTLNFVSWNKEAWKTGICNVPPLGQERNLLTLSNNTCIRITLEEVRNRFLKLFKRKANLHHYTDYIEVADISCASRNVKDIIFEYERQN